MAWMTFSVSDTPDGERRAGRYLLPVYSVSAGGASAPQWQARVNGAGQGSGDACVSVRRPAGVGAACSSSQRAQQIVRRTHSGDAAPAVVAVGVLVAVAAEVSLKGMLSQRTKASSRWTRMRGLVPTCASRMREAARAR